MIGVTGPRRARYQGDITATAVVPGVAGPNTFGEFLAPCGADYDPDTDVTTVFYRYATNADYAAAAR